MKTTVKILGRRESVVADELVGREDRCFGQWRPGRGEIAIDPALAHGQQGETLVHEIIECINGHLELGLKHPQISALSQVLHQVLVDNAPLIADVCAGRPIVWPRKRP